MTHTNHARDRPSGWGYSHAKLFTAIHNLF